MRGVTLIEFMAGLSLFLVLLFFGYHAFDSQRRILQNVTARTEPEEESNYRLLLIKHFLERSSRQLKVDPFLEQTTIFFPDLSFGKTPQKNAFSVAHVTGVPIPFVRSGVNYRLPAGTPVEKQKTYLMSGSDVEGNFGWNYANSEQIWTSNNGVAVRFQQYTSNAELEKGVLIEVEIHGFLFQNQTLYWVSPGGALQPYLSSLDEFEYVWKEPTLTVQWKKGRIEMEFQCEL